MDSSYKTKINKVKYIKSMKNIALLKKCLKKVNLYNKEF